MTETYIDAGDHGTRRYAAGTGSPRNGGALAEPSRAAAAGAEPPRPRIGVMGTASLLGRTVAEHMRGRVGWWNVFSLSRPPGRIEPFDGGDRILRCDTPDQLAGALDQVDRLVLVGARDPRPDEDWHAEVVSAAGRTGIERLVYTSLLAADTSPMPGAAAHLRMEALVAGSGIPATVLRVGCMFEDLLLGFDRVLATGVLPGATGDAALSPASAADYAFATGSVATKDGGHEGLLHELAGDWPWAMADVAAEISWRTGRDVVHRDLTPNGLGAALRGMGLTAEDAEARVGLDAAAAAGAWLDRGRQLGLLRGLPTTSLAEAVFMALCRSGVEPPAWAGPRPGSNRGRHRAGSRTRPRPLA